LTGKTFAIWGLSFKPNTDDMREAPSLVIINGLVERGAKIKAFDPVAMNEAAHMLESVQSSVEFVDDMYAATEDADALVIVTEWKTFRSPDFERLKRQLKKPLIFDGRNIYDPAALSRDGFKYHGIGRSN